MPPAYYLVQFYVDKEICAVPAEDTSVGAHAVCRVKWTTGQTYDAKVLASGKQSLHGTYIRTCTCSVHLTVLFIITGCREDMKKKETEFHTERDKENNAPPRKKAKVEH